MSSPSLNPDFTDFALPDPATPVVDPRPATPAVESDADSDEAPDAGETGAKNGISEELEGDEGGEPEVVDVEAKEDEGKEDEGKKEIVKVGCAGLKKTHWKTAFKQAGLPEDTEPYTCDTVEPQVEAHMAEFGNKPDVQLFVPMLPEEVQGKLAASDDASDEAVKYHASYFGPKGATTKETSAMAKKGMRSRYNTLRKQSSSESTAKAKGVEKSFWLGKSIARAELDKGAALLYDTYLEKLTAISLAEPTEWLDADAMAKELKKEKELVKKFKSDSEARVAKNAMQQAAREKKAAEQLARQGKERKNKVSAARKNESDPEDAVIMWCAVNEEEEEDDEPMTMEQNGRYVAILMQRAREYKAKKDVSFKEALDFVKVQKATNKRLLAEQEAAA